MKPRRPDIVQVRKLEDPAALRRRLTELGLVLPTDDSVDPAGPLADRLAVGSLRDLPNRWAILPMEGWDASAHGRPTDLVRRRWARFGESGAGLIWGGEAVAVVHSGRANPNQLCIGADSERDLGELRSHLIRAHADANGTDPGNQPVVGLQLTHSGRWARPDGQPRPRTAWTHPLLDDRCGAGVPAVLSDGELEDLVAAFAAAARVAAAAGFDFVDVKQCHGYLGHELLSAVDRPGPYGGDLAGRTRWITTVLDAVRSEAPGLALASRVSLYDMVPFVAGPDGSGVPQQGDPGSSVPFCFGGDGSGTGVDLTETHQLMDILAAHGVELVCATAGSPYYVPHAQRPAFFPPSDGYRPPEDPLVEVVRMASATRSVTEMHPDLVVVGSGLTYLQEHLPNVAQALVREGWMHSAGIGRMALSHPSLPADTLAGRAPERRLICRTFSDCTTAPRNGLVSGCYPLDGFYRQRPERITLASLKRQVRAARPDGSESSEGEPEGQDPQAP